MSENLTASDPQQWVGALQSGDIVAFRFPHQWAGGSDAPKVRPALVVDVVEQDGNRSAVLAYGTSNASLKTDANTLDVQVPAEVEHASLKKPTRFHISRRIRVPLNDGGFVVKISIGTPVLGKLSGNSQKRLTDIRTRMCRDKKAERRSYLSRNRRPWILCPQSSINQQPTTTTT